MSSPSILPAIFRLCALVWYIKVCVGDGLYGWELDLPGTYTPGIMIAEESTRKIEKSGLDMSAI